MSRSSELTYTPAWWVPGTHLQTLWGKLFQHAPVIATRAERWPTPDDDEIDVHRLEAPPGSDRRTPRLPLLPSDICYNVAMMAENNAAGGEGMIRYEDVDSTPVVRARDIGSGAITAGQEICIERIEDGVAHVELWALIEERLF